MGAKLGIEFDGFDILSKKLKDLDGDVRSATESALKASHQIVTRKVSAAIAPHRESGETAGSIERDSKVTWTNDVAEIGVGFNISEGGLASIFLMYGTQLHGQPHITPDRKLYDAVYGSQTKKEIRQIQEEVILKRIERVMK